MTLRCISQLCFVAALLLLSACSPPEDETFSSTERMSPTLECVLLLHQLLGEEQHLSKLLLVKKESDALESLVKRISDTAAAHVQPLEEMAYKYGGKTGVPVLPPGEAATREAIAKTKRDALLGASGPEFEFELLLTQAEALNYGAHLALVVSEKAQDPEHTALFLRIRNDLSKLRADVMQQLRATSRKL